jgi:hypothetical protein
MGAISNVKARILYRLSNVPPVRSCAETFGSDVNTALSPFGIKYKTGVTFNIATLKRSEDAYEVNSAIDALYQSGRKRGLMAIEKYAMPRSRFFSGISLYGDPMKTYRVCKNVGLSLAQYIELSMKIAAINANCLFNANLSPLKYEIAFAKAVARIRAEVKSLPLLIAIATLDHGWHSTGDIVNNVVAVYDNTLTCAPIEEDLVNLCIRYLDEKRGDKGWRDASWDKPLKEIMTSNNYDPNELRRPGI